MTGLVVVVVDDVGDGVDCVSIWTLLERFVVSASMVLLLSLLMALLFVVVGSLLSLLVLIVEILLY